MIKTALWGTAFECGKGVTAAELLDEASRYGIAGVLSDNLDIFCPDDTDTRARWLKLTMADYRNSINILFAQTSLCEVLAAENIKPVILKGLASAHYYPNPLFRHVGDIDFIILPDQFNACCKLLEQNGYTAGPDGTRHLEFMRQGIIYECHRYFSFNITDEDKKTDQIIYDGCRNCVMQSIDGKEYYALPDLEHGIALLEHLKHHLLDGVGFRQIIDWIIYADKVLDNDAWNTSFQKMARECGLERLAIALTKASQIFLGLKTDNMTWCEDVDDSVCTSLIEMIFSCNNFGYASENDQDSYKAGKIIRSGIITKFNSRALKHMPAAREHIILRPAAYAYQLLRWCINGGRYFLCKRNKDDVSVKKWKDQRDLLKQLGL